MALCVRGARRLDFGRALAFPPMTNGLPMLNVIPPSNSVPAGAALPPGLPGAAASPAAGPATPFAMVLSDLRVAGPKAKSGPPSGGQGRATSPSLGGKNSPGTASNSTASLDSAPNPAVFSPIVVPQPSPPTEPPPAAKHGTSSSAAIQVLEQLAPALASELLPLVGLQGDGSAGTPSTVTGNAADGARQGSASAEGSAKSVMVSPALPPLAQQLPAVPGMANQLVSGEQPAAQPNDASKHSTSTGQDASAVLKVGAWSNQGAPLDAVAFGMATPASAPPQSEADHAPVKSPMVQDSAGLAGCASAAPQNAADPVASANGAPQNAPDAGVHVNDGPSPLVAPPSAPGQPSPSGDTQISDTVSSRAIPQPDTPAPGDRARMIEQMLSRLAPPGAAPAKVTPAMSAPGSPGGSTTGQGAAHDSGSESSLSQNCAQPDATVTPASRPGHFQSSSDHGDPRGSVPGSTADVNAATTVSAPGGKPLHTPADLAAQAGLSNGATTGTMPTTSGARPLSASLLPSSPLPTPVAPPPLPGDIVRASQLYQRLGGSEMHIAMDTDLLGAIDVRAVVHQSALTATIGVQRADVQALLANELPALQHALAERSVQVEQISVLSGATGNRMDLSGQAQQQQHGSSAAYTSFLPAAQAPGPSRAEQLQAVSGEALSFDGSAGRLSIRV